MNHKSTARNLRTNFMIALFSGLLLLLSSLESNAQLGVYSFTGTGNCPNQNPSVTIQPLNAVFSDFVNVNATCDPIDNAFQYKDLNGNTTIDLGQYHEFGITPNLGFALNLVSLSFTHICNDQPNSGVTTWVLRSNQDNFTSDIATGTVDIISQTANINFPSSGFTNITTTVKFRIYIINIKSNGSRWSIDDVALNGTAVPVLTTVIPQDPADPILSNPLCSGSSNATLIFGGTPPPGETWYWQTSLLGTSTANSASSYVVSSAGTYYVKSRNDLTLQWSLGAGSISVSNTPAVGMPNFVLGNTSTRCMGAGVVSYKASANNSSNIIYSLDAASITGGNTIDALTGDVTYDAAWSGITTITATAEGCNGPKSKSHVVTITPGAGVPVFTLGATSTRCQGSGSVTYTAASANSTDITYSLDAASITGGNSINSSNGKVTYSAAWSGTTVITATATGCNGTASDVHTVTIIAAVGAPVFALGATTTRCQGAGTVMYTATSTNSTVITYSLDAASITGGNSINAATGEVTYSASWTGTSTITATVNDCTGPISSNHTVSIKASVGIPVFSLGANSTRCSGAMTVTYTATVVNSTSVIYSLDAASVTGGNTINPSTGAVTYTAGWTDPSTITVTATGCNGTSSASHLVSVNPDVTIPVFASGAVSTRCQGNGSVFYVAGSTNQTALTYSLDAATFNAGNSINSATGEVMYASNWLGTTIITAKATGCNGPQSATHTVTITPSVDLPVFALGSTSTRCEGAGDITYNATAANSTSISYNLDAASVTGGNSINSSTGEVTYDAAWTGTSVITANADGCNGPVTTTHTVTTTSSIATPVFGLGSTSTRCQGAGSVTYTATAVNSTGITYSLDAASVTGGNTINASTGKVTYAAGWNGSSIITATASGCNGPTSDVHTVTVTPTVGEPVFALGSTSARCQGSGTVNYAATSADNTGLTYSLDAASITGGNSINAATGDVTYAGNWNGITTITATATGCNGPVTSIHKVTVNADVSTPVFAMGNVSIYNQGAGSVTYTATANNSTGITYSLDAASISGGNTINATTGEVNWSAAWYGTSMITATATGCNGPTVSTHIVTINAAIVQTPLYLSTPGLALDRIDPVSTGITTTLQSSALSSGGTTNVTFTQNPALCNDLVIKAQTISVSVYVNITSGSMPATPSITAAIKYGSTNVISLANPVYNAGTGMLTWTGILGTDVTVPAGQALALTITTAQSGVTFTISYHSMSKPSRISLLPVSTFIDITSFNVYNAPYPGGSIRTNATSNTPGYVRAVVTTPFGYKDITGLSINVSPLNVNVNAVCVDSTACSRIYEYAWTTPPATGTYYLMATAREGFENNIKNSELLPFDNCTACPPAALNDSATGAGGSPVIVNVLLNDYDPNNNMKPSTLAISVQPNNGTGYISNGKVVYLPNGAFAGKDTLTYQVCDSTGLCGTGKVFFTINPFIVDPCSEATKSHVYFLPFSENEARIALDSSTNVALASNNIRTVISLKMPYPGMVLVWDHWEDGYEANALSPQQSSTKIWGDGNPYNGIAPGYNDDIIPAGGSIVLDNTMPTNPRVQANIFYDGKDKITASGQITVTQVSGEPSIMAVQCMKTNVSPTSDYGTSFTIPAGQNFPSQDFRYTSLFIRAAQNNTTVSIDKDNNGTLETTATLSEGQVMHVNGGVMSGAAVTATAPIGVELHFGGNDNYSSRDVPIFPATWYYNTYYSPVPTTGRAATPADSAVVMLYNSLNRPLTINWSSGIPSSGTVNLPAKTVIRFPLAKSQTAAYKFVNPTGESFTAIQICDSYTPGGGGNTGSDFDWSFNLIALNRLTDFATVAWAPGSLDGTRNDNPVWVTPTNNTTIYVKYDGNVSGNSGSMSPCGMRYDATYTLNALNFKRLLDPTDKDQSGLAVFTCDGTKLAAVYGEDASTATVANPSWDVGSTIQPFCKQKLVFANDDYGRTLVNQPVTLPILLNDFGFLAVIDPASVSTVGFLQPKHGTVTINSNGTLLYTPAPGFVGKDTFEYNVCSTPTPVVCDDAKVYIDISVCPAPYNANVLGGQVFHDKNKDGLNNDGGYGIQGAKVYLYMDGNCNTLAESNELKDSVTVDASGMYQFITYPEKVVSDDFDGPSGTRTCANGTDGNSAWATNWVDAGDPSTGFCNTGQSAANTDAEIVKDGAFSYALRLKDNNVSATRTVNLTGASYAFLSFSYRRKSATLTAGKNIIVQASSNGSTFGTVYTIAGDGTTDAGYVNIYNQDISAYISSATYIRFLTNNSVADADTVYIDNIKIQFLTYPQCYITRIDSTTIPANFGMTTVTKRSFTAASSQTCLGPFDFGIAKNNVSISGKLFNDANGLTDNLVNGTAMGMISTMSVYAYLVDTSGKVIFRTTLDPATGAYSFPQAEVQSAYKVMLSTISVNPGLQCPVNAGISANWMTTGDAFGLNNQAGSGIKSDNFDASITVITANSNITEVNFGIERLPDSDDKTVSYAINTPGLTYSIPALSGTDAEDGTLGTGKTFRINSLPANADLYYNGVLVTQGQVIPLFNPVLLKIDPADQVFAASFTYASMDTAGFFDPSPATVLVNWIGLLPITLLDFNGKLNVTEVDLAWKTSTESNSSHFEVERSNDGVTFKQIAKVKAKGFSTAESSYSTIDPSPEKGNNYYRLKMVDNDNSFVYSKIIMVRVNDIATLETKVSPNPFTGKLDIYLNLTHDGPVTFKFLDVNGKGVYMKKVDGLKGFNWFVVNDLEKLPTAPYILQVITNEKTFIQKLVKQ